MNKDHLPDFSGKCISLRIVDSENSHDLYDPSFEYQGGRLFLVGTIPDGATDSGWDANQKGGIAWDSVKNYVLFDDLEAYNNAIELSEAYLEDDDDEYFDE